MKKNATPAKVFVRDPALYGRYIRTHRSVLLVACPLCNAAVGAPCSGVRGNHTGMTHSMRRHAAREQEREAQREAHAMSQSRRDTARMTTTEIRSRHVRCEGCEGKRFLITLRRGARPLVRCADCEREVK